MRAASSAVPNVLSVARLLGAPVLVLAAALGAVPVFWAVLAVTLLLDVADGFAARRLGATSDLGRRLDSVADYAIAIALLPGLAWLWPSVVRVEAPWLGLGIVTYFAPTIYCLLRWRIVPGYHTWSAKVVSALLCVTLVLRLTVGVAWPLHAAILLQVGVMVEEFAIALTLPGWSGNMPTVWHARRCTVEKAR